MTFNHDNQGISINYKNIILNGAAVTEEFLTDEEILDFSIAFLKFNQTLGRISTKELKPSDLKISVTNELSHINKILVINANNKKVKWK